MPPANLARNGPESSPPRGVAGVSLAPAIDRRLLLTATAAHFLNDFHVAFLAPLLPLVVVKFNLSLALAGLVATRAPPSPALSPPGLGRVAAPLGRHLLPMRAPARTRP